MQQDLQKGDRGIVKTKASQNEMTVTILGSGTCVPSLKRSACSVLVETDGKKLLFDTGPGTMRRLLEAETEIWDISHIFISHFHPDHTGELATFLFSNKYPAGRRRKQKLTLVGGKGFFRFFDGLKGVYGDWIQLGPDLMEIAELDNTERDTRKFGGFTVESVPVEHNDESIAYRINSSGKSAVYSGDTDYSENLIKLSEDADLLVCECALPNALKVPGHLTPSLAGKMASKANVKKLVLTHLYPECDEADIEKECRATFGGIVAIAEDLMKFVL